MGIKIRIRRGIVHLVTTCGGIRTEESTGLHISENPEQNKEVMKLAELLRSKKRTSFDPGVKRHDSARVEAFTV